jgi:hypothetical protein
MPLGHGGIDGDLDPSGTAAAQTNQTLGLYASSQTYGQSSSSTYDARSITLVGSGGISVGNSGGSFLISAAAGGAQSNQSLGVYASSQTYGQSSSSTYDARSMSIVGSGGVSVGNSAGSILISGQTTVAQTNQTLGIYASSQTTGQSSSSTHDARTLTIVGQGANSVGWSGGSLLISAPNTIAQSAESQSFGMSNLGNTSGTTGMASGAQVRMVIVGGDNITVSQSLNGASGTISISGPAAGGQTVQTLGIYGSSQTTGQSSSSTVDARSLTFVGQGGLSVGMSAGSVILSGATGGGAGFSAGVSTGGVTGGSTGITGTRLVLVGTQGMQLSQSTDANGGTVSILPVAASRFVVNPTLYHSGSSTSLIGQTLVTVKRMEIPHFLSISRIDVPFQIATTSQSSANTAANAQSWFWGLYTQNGSTLSPLSAGSSSTTWSWASNSAGTAFNGPRLFTFAMATALTPGDYFFALQVSTATSSVGTATTALSMSVSPVYVSTQSTQIPREMGQAGANTRNDWTPFQGVNTVSMSHTSQTMELSQMRLDGVSGVRANIGLILRNV